MARPFKLNCSKLAPFRIRGEVPYGGPDDRPALSSPIPAEACTEVLKQCWALVQAGLAVSTLPSTSDMEDENPAAPIDARTLVQGICSYRDQTLGMKTPELSWADFRADQRVTPLDVMSYVFRVVDRLLVETRAESSALPGGCPVDAQKVKHGLEQLAERVRGAAASAYIDLEAVATAT